MKHMIALALALVMTLCTGFALADDAEITVQGTAVITADPDIVRLTASASVTAATVVSAQDEMNRIVEAATNKLLDLGIKPEDIVTQNYGYYPTYSYDYEADDGNTSKITGYQTNHALTITCHNIEMLDSVIAAITESGMNEIYGVSYDTSARSDLYQQALSMAISAAQVKAEAMAKASGMTLAQLDQLTENSAYADAYTVNTLADRAESSMMDAGAGTGIRSGSVSVQASVTAVYEARK